MQSSAHEDWSVFVENTCTPDDHFQADENVANNETLKACQNNISITDVDNPSNGKDSCDVSDSWCKVDECPAGVTDTLCRSQMLHQERETNLYEYSW